MLLLFLEASEEVGYFIHPCAAGITGSLSIALTGFGFSPVTPISGLDGPRVQPSAAFLVLSLPVKAASTAGLAELSMCAQI